MNEKNKPQPPKEKISLFKEGARVLVNYSENFIEIPEGFKYIKICSYYGDYEQEYENIEVLFGNLEVINNPHYEKELKQYKIDLSIYEKKLARYKEKQEIINLKRKNKRLKLYQKLKEEFENQEGNSSV